MILLSNKMFYPKNPSPPPMETPDPPLVTCLVPQNRGNLTPHDIPRVLRGKCCFQTRQNHHIFHQIAQGVFLIDILILIIYTPQND